MRRVRVGMCSLAVVIAAAGLTGCPPIVLTLDSATLSMVVDDTAALERDFDEGRGYLHLEVE